MKKKLLSFCLLTTGVFTAGAQVTITQSDMPVVGKAYIQANDSTVTSFGGSGSGQTWNFSGWTNKGTDTSAIYTASALDGSSNFPTATMGSIDGGDKPSTSFFKLTSTEMEILGFYGDLFQTGTPSAVAFNPSMKMITFPSVSGTAFTSTWGLDIFMYYGQNGIDSVHVHMDADYSSLMDGEGSITTPVNTFNALRQKVTEVETNNTYLKGTATGGQWISSGAPEVRTSYSYRWWGSPATYPIAEVSADSANVVTDASYLLDQINAPPPPVGIIPIPEKSMVSVFPNPASDKLNITGISATSCIVVLDMEGRLLESSLIKKSNSTINVSDYQNGIYFYQIVDLNGNVLSKGKFAVAK